MARSAVRISRSGEKLYPFSFGKYEKALESRMDRLYFLIQNMEDHETAWDPSTYYSMVAEKDDLEEILGYCHDPVSFLPGRLYGTAKDAIEWAGNRGHRIW